MTLAADIEFGAEGTVGLDEKARSIVSSVINFAGYEIRRPGATGRSMRDALRHLRNVGCLPRSIIDVGVANGTADLYRTYPEPIYLLVEPLVEFEPALQALLATRIRGTYVLAAAGAHQSTSSLRVRGEASTQYREVDGSDSNAEIRTVPVRTLDELCEQVNLAGPYLLKIDVQGAELDVIAGATTILRETEAVILEVSLLQLLEGIPVFTSVIRQMDEYGFAAYDMFDGLARPADGTLAQIDVMFVKTAGRFRTYHGFRKSPTPPT